ncbi:AraC family transcriptional regulator [Actinocatenispora thailandica]|uniref:AraC family transcriptional regulator n=1 Tax=Actinocatenispora thailandica TaxID=227318 RepID=A0A7R7HZK9_9ACTN|nr:AraC family transcriptional regulator [Actinocatenispora thailandica]BCJ38373.1 AraC family transcriptional regulator [Actinocatenispora thailandica]
MLATVTLAARAEFAVTAVTCRDEQVLWTRPAARGDHRLVLVRHGRFRRATDGAAADLDRTVGYLGTPHEEERFAHPAGDDACTSVSFAAGLWDGRAAARSVYVDARIELAHRRLLAAARGGDVDYALVEELLGLVAAAAGHPEPRPGVRDQALVAAARTAVLDDAPEAARLCSLSALLGVSPYRLSRVFSVRMGVSLTRYRNRVRVGRALDRLGAGESDLAGLAARLGFADQAHLTRTVRAQLGHTPTALRRLLTPQTGTDERGGPVPRPTGADERGQARGAAGASTASGTGAGGVARRVR